MAKTYKVSTVEVSAQSRKEWLARKRGKGEVAASAAAVVVQSEASSAPSALDALFRQVNIGTDDAPKYVAEALFPLRIGDALLDWHADQKYLGVEHATESEKANFFATGGVTAGGIGSSSGGGTGGGGSSTLAGLNDVSLKSAIANDMLVYNGTHWVNTPMSAIKPDLTAYATKTWVESKGYALNTALLAVDARLANVETIFTADQDGAINKWGEVVAFLDGIEGDRLDSILSQFATMQWVEGQKYITAEALAPYALETAIPTNNSQLDNGAGYITLAALNGYATQDWVEGKKYLDGIDSTMVIAALGYTPYNAANFTKANIKSTLGISDWALAASKPSYEWSEINGRPTNLSQFTDDVVSGKYLPIGGTAADAAKLGGEAPSYYATVTALTILSDAVTEFRTLFDSLFEKDTTNNAIKAKLSLYSLGGITAGGIGSGGSSSGGGASYNRLDAWADYSQSKAGYVLSALLGKDLDTRVNALANAGYITSAALDPYAKTADVANTYATQTALQGVDIRVQAIEYIFEKDQDGVINKWQEIVDFLAGVEGTTLDAILDQFATKDSLSGYIPKTGGTFSGSVKVIKDFGGNLSDFATKQHYGAFEVGRASNNMCLAIGVTDDDYGYIQSKGWGVTNQGNLVLNPMGGSLYYSAELKPIFHEGNYTNYVYSKAQVVPKNGGEFTNAITISKDISGGGRQLILNGTSAEQVNWNTIISFRRVNEELAYIGSSAGTEGLGSLNFVVAGVTSMYLNEKGLTVNSNVTAPAFIGNLTGNASGAEVLIPIQNQNEDEPLPNALPKGLRIKFKRHDKVGFSTDANGYWWTAVDVNAFGGGGTSTGKKLQLMFTNSDSNPTATDKLYARFGRDEEWRVPREIAFLDKVLPLTGGTLDGALRITDSTTIEKNLFVDKNIYIAESSSDGGIYFGDDEYAYIKETPDDVMTIASNQGLILKVNHISDEGAVIKLDGPVRIGDAILSWDSTNKCVTIKNANTGEKASLLVYGGVTATAKN